MPEPAKVTAKMFEELDRAHKGIAYRPLSSAEESTEKVRGQSLESTKSFKVDLGHGTVEVDRATFQDFLSRNPNLQNLKNLSPEKAIEELRNLQMSHFPAWGLLQEWTGQKPLHINVFSFVSEKLDEIEAAKRDPSSPLYPFSFLLALLDVKNVSMSSEVRKEQVAKGLDNPNLHVAFGTEDAAIRGKIIQDAYEFHPSRRA